MNIGGGRWLIHIDKARRDELLDYYWLELVYYNSPTVVLFFLSKLNLSYEC